jgi:hypothetical protein
MRKETFNFWVFWAFNAGMSFAYLGIRILEAFSSIGMGQILITGTPEIQSSVLGSLGASFVQLLWACSMIAVVCLWGTVWLFGNAYILRREVSDLLNYIQITYFHHGDL